MTGLERSYLAKTADWNYSALKRSIRASNRDSDAGRRSSAWPSAWANRNFPMPDKQFQYKASGKSIPYEELDLERPWETFDMQHELTRKGIEKFAADYRATLSRPA